MGNQTLEQKLEKKGFRIIRPELTYEYPRLSTQTLELDWIEKDHRLTIIYKSCPELLIEGVYELFIGIYNSLRGEK